MKMTMRGLIVGAFVMTASCQGREVAHEAVKFGPPSAEAEIRSAFAIKGDLPDIRTMMKLADSQGIVYEQPQDRSLRYCGVGRDRTNLSITIFFFGRKSRVHGQRNYVAAYSSDGQVLCIETRHAYTSL